MNFLITTTINNIIEKPIDIYNNKKKKTGNIIIDLQLKRIEQKKSEKEKKKDNNNNNKNNNNNTNMHLGILNIIRITASDIIIKNEKNV